MSNRMSVLSRRLGRFAGGFSFATVALFSIGLYAAANTKGQVVFLFAGLVLVCLFASFFLWLAYGFAWAMIPQKPAEEKRPVEALKPAEAMNPADLLKTAEPMKPAEPVKPAEVLIPAEAKKPAMAMKSVEEMKPAEEKVIVSEDPPDAKYTIAGRRVY
jgi:cytoskeletal protein RodZ